MKDIVFEELIRPIMVILLGFLTSYAIKFINTQSELLKSDKALKDNLYYKRIIDDIKEIILQVVITLNQTFVDALKAEGKFTIEKQQEAFEKAKSDVYTILSTEMIDVLIAVYGDIDAWLDSKIESTVSAIKEEAKSKIIPAKVIEVPLVTPVETPNKELDKLNS